MADLWTFGKISITWTTSTHQFASSRPAKAIGARSTYFSNEHLRRPIQEYIFLRFSICLNVIQKKTEPEFFGQRFMVWKLSADMKTSSSISFADFLPL